MESRLRMVISQIKAQITRLCIQNVVKTGREYNVESQISKAVMKKGND